MPTEEKKMYIGPNEVRCTIELEETTPKGDFVVEVQYEGERVKTEYLPKKVVDLLLTDKPQDWTWVRDTRCKPLLEELASVCLEHAVRSEDLNYVLAGFSSKLEEGFNRATSYLWTKDDKSYVPSMSPLRTVSLLDADRVLKAIPHADAGGEEKTA